VDNPVITAMEKAIRKRKTTGSPIFHSDRGSQYASYAFRRLLAANRIRQSMSGKGNCYDNAMAESFFKTLNSTLKCNSMTSFGRCGAAVGFVLFPPSKMRSTNETLQPAHAGTKIHNIFDA